MEAAAVVSLLLRKAREVALNPSDPGLPLNLQPDLERQRPA